SELQGQMKGWAHEIMHSGKVRNGGENGRNYLRLNRSMRDTTTIHLFLGRYKTIPPLYLLTNCR
ncbi:hypothetical protein KYX90_12865, partial [Enterococcus lactis]|uniref:hypothetical protein n=1 Tax=Enterococcus lactis TaxID=357441 RepID=UPI001C7D101D